jgi:hypothetical protein
MPDTSQDLDGRASPPAGACRTFSWLVFYRCIIRNCLLGIGGGAAVSAVQEALHAATD